MDGTTTGPTRRELLSALAEIDALPMKATLDYYTIDDDVYEQAVRLIRARGWFAGVTAKREEFNSGTFESFEIAGIEFTSPRGCTPLTEPRPVMPIEKLDGAITVNVDGHEVEITGPIAEGLRAAVYHAARGPLPSPDESDGSNVIPLGIHGRGRLVASEREGA